MTVLLPIIAVLSVTAEWSQRSGLTTFTLVPHRGRVMSRQGHRGRAGRRGRHPGGVRGRRGRQPGRLRPWPARPRSGTSPSPTSAASPWATLLLQMVGFTLGALIRNSAGADRRLHGLCLRRPGPARLPGLQPGVVPRLRPWVDAKYSQDALLQGGLAGEQWAHLDRHDGGLARRCRSLSALVKLRPFGGEVRWSAPSSRNATGRRRC